MRLSAIRYLLAALLVLPLAGALLQARGADAGADGQFVQGFYDWYTAKAGADGVSWAIALEQRGTDFDPPLRDALKADLAAQAKVKDDIVGLDFDPFLNTQDPEGIYKVESITKSGKVSKVQVTQATKDAAATVAVTAVVTLTNGHWRFVNFVYPDGGNLLDILATLKKERGGN
jgi:hypothetical protein